MSKHQITRRCLTMEVHEHLALIDDVYRANRRTIEAAVQNARLLPRTTVARIPVVVHVVYRSANENVSDEQVHSQIDALNQDFRMRNDDISKTPEAFRSLVADALIEFQLAVRDPAGRPSIGVTRTRTDFPIFEGKAAEIDDMLKVRTAPAWPAHHYMNLWVCTLGEGLLGYAQFPGGPATTDGIVVNNACFGTQGTALAPFNLGRTATHEVGHWLNLLHIWGDDAGGCHRSDNVGDTPNQAGSNIAKPSYPRISCNNGPHGDMFMNYMDYVDDAAMFMFTKGQVERMHATLRSARRELLDSPALMPVETPRISMDIASGRFTELGSIPEQIFDGVEWVSAQ